MKQTGAALIALALCLAPPAQAGNNLNMPPAPAQAATAGNQQEPQPAPAKAGAPGAAENRQDQQARYPGFSNGDTPVAISCNISGLAGRTILVPAGKNPMDFCPATAIAIHPQIANGPPPANWHSLDMEQDNIARDELRALELRNKTPGQQTPEQKTSGQQPP